MQAIRGIHVVEGRPCPSADTLVAVCKRSSICEYFREVQTTEIASTWETKRRGEDRAVRATFALDDAKRAGLAGRKNWQAYPKRMLSARAKAYLARDTYPELVLGLYTPDEMGEGPVVRLPAWDQSDGLDSCPAPKLGAESTVQLDPGPEYIKVGVAPCQPSQELTTVVVSDADVEVKILADVGANFRAARNLEQLRASAIWWKPKLDGLSPANNDVAKALYRECRAKLDARAKLARPLADPLERVVARFARTVDACRDQTLDPKDTLEARAVADREPGDDSDELTDEQRAYDRARRLDPMDPMDQ
jgi:hypothetical protein